MAVASDLARLFDRELDRLANEVAAYESDAALWSTTGAQKNAPATLALHLVGGLLHYIGAALGASGYVRDRDREFSERSVSRDEIVRRVRECRDVVVPVLARLPEEALGRPYPGIVPGPLEGLTTNGMLDHLLWHLGWHTGHIYYHRLGLDGRGPAGEIRSARS
jgi:hypothetical protein